MLITTMNTSVPRFWTARKTANEVAKHLQVSHHSTHEIIHNRLHFIYASCFWYWQGPIPEHYHEKGPTVRSAHYCTKLWELTAAIRNICSTLLSKVFYHCMTMLIHILPSNLLKPSGNSTPDVLEHTPYSNDFLQTSTSQFTMTQWDHQFASEQKVKELVHIQHVS
jgi:hypothetical protein